MLTQVRNAVREQLNGEAFKRHRYGWIITKVFDTDLDTNESKEVPDHKDVGTFGPFNTKLTSAVILEKGIEFRMLDDDEFLVYEGKFYDPKMKSPDDLGEEAFTPLDDYGKPNYGCTMIQYKNSESGKWETL